MSTPKIGPQRQRIRQPKILSASQSEVLTGRQAIIQKCIARLRENGDIKTIATSFGPAVHQLSNPLAGTFIRGPNGERRLLVSSCYEKPVQIFSEDGAFIGTLADSTFRDASAIIRDNGYVYIADDSRGIIGKFDMSTGEKIWQIKAPITSEDLPSELPANFNISQYKHSRMIGSMIIIGERLYAYNTAISKIQIKTSEESLELDGDLLFNGHHDLASLNGNILASQSGLNLGEIQLPNIIKLISEEGDLLAEGTLSNKIGDICGIAVDNSRKRVFIAIKNKVVVIENGAFKGFFIAPSCQSRIVKNITYDNVEDRLIIFSHNMKNLGDSAIDILTPEAISALSNLSRRAHAQETAHQLLPCNLKIRDCSNLTPLEDDLVEYEKFIRETDFMGPREKIRATNSRLDSVRRVAEEEASFIYTDSLPLDLQALLEKYGYDEYIRANVGVIVFVPHLQYQEEELSGAVINGSFLDLAIFPGKSRVLLNTYYDRLKPQSLSEFNYAHTLIHEAAHKELQRLAEERKLPLYYVRFLEPFERYACIKQKQFLLKMQADFTELHQLIQEKVDELNQKIAGYNIKMGLEPSNEIPLPLD
jgi:hypothetical protein